MVVRHVGYRNSKEYKGYVVVTGNRMRIWWLKCLSGGGVASNWFEGSQSWEENRLSSLEREQERKYDLRWNYSLRIFWERINFASPKLPDFKVADKRDLPIARCLRGLGVFKARRRTASILEKVNYLVTVNIVVSLLYFTFKHRIYRLSPHTIQTPSRDRCISAELNFGLESRAFGNRLPRFWLKNGSSSHITGIQNLSLTKCLPGVTLLFRNCAGILKGADWDCATLGKRCF